MSDSFQNPYQNPGQFDNKPKQPSDQKPTGLVMAPAITLIVLASVAIIADLIGFVGALTRDVPPMDPNLPEFLQEMQRGQVGIGAALVQGALGVMSLVALLGSIQMLRFKAWGFALTGAILMMINFGNCCCILSCPVGIWAIIVLCQPNVKKWFD